MTFGSVCDNKANKYQNKDVLKYLLQINFGDISMLSGQGKQKNYMDRQNCRRMS